MAFSDSELIAAAQRQVEESALEPSPLSLRGVRRAELGAMLSELGDRRNGDGLLNYQLLRELQRGGQGVVYEAMQHGTNRRVAIKVIRAGPLAGANERARFEREVQILGALQHPSIVTILESGRAGGCDFFVMQYVDGPDLEAHVQQIRPPADASRLLNREHLRRIVTLMARTSEAVHAAHLSGVVHRDLKPTNIRIAAEEQPRILDFGLAKRMPGTDDPSAGGDDVTLTGEFVGTLPYASPEQAGGAVHVDTRTDVYSLGVILYRLLTRQFPYEIAGPVSEVIGRIRSTPPRRPSELNPEIGSDLETILLRCLQKEPARRYETAGDLARDLRRWLNGEPIEARRDSAAYLLRLYVRRHKAAFGAGAAAAVVVLGALVTSLWFWGTAVQERDRAIRAQAAEQMRAAELATSLAAESAAKESAVRAADESGAMRSFVLALLSSADPEVNQGRDLKVREMLDQGAGELLAQHMEAQPALRSTLLLTLGEAYRSLGAIQPAMKYIDQAVALRDETLGGRNPDTLRARLSQVELFVSAGRYQQAATQLDEIGEALRDNADAGPLLIAKYDLQRGIALRELGKLAESEAALTAAIEGHRATAAGNHSIGVSLNAMGVLCLRQQKYGVADGYFEQALDHVRAEGGSALREVGAILNNQGTSQYYQGQYGAADPLFLAAYEELRKFYGEAHPQTVTVANNRCALLRKLGRLQEAEAFGVEVVARRREIFGSLHPEVATSLTNLALIYSDREEYARSELLLGESLEIRRQCMPGTHFAVAEAERTLGLNLIRQGRFEEAERHLLHGYQQVQTDRDVPAARRARFIDSLADLYENWGRPEEAAKWVEMRSVGGP